MFLFLYRYFIDQSGAAVPPSQFKKPPDFFLRKPKACKLSGIPLQDPIGRYIFPWNCSGVEYSSVSHFDPLRDRTTIADKDIISNNCPFYGNFLFPGIFHRKPVSAPGQIFFPDRIRSADSIRSFQNSGPNETVFPYSNKSSDFTGKKDPGVFSDKTAAAQKAGFQMNALADTDSRLHIGAGTPSGMADDTGTQNRDSRFSGGKEQFQVSIQLHGLSPFCFSFSSSSRSSFSVSIYSSRRFSVAARIPSSIQIRI